MSPLQPLWSLSLEMLHSPDVESPNPNPPISTDESQPHKQWGCGLIEFPWSQWTHTQNLQVPVLAFDKQMTSMELRSQPAKTRVREWKNKVLQSDKPNIDSPGIEPSDVYPVCVEAHTHTQYISPLVSHSETASPLLSITVWMECMCK